MIVSIYFAMDISVLFQRLCHVEFRRLLLIIGISVAVVVYQYFAISYGNSLRLSLVSDKGLVAMMVGNVTIIDVSKSTKVNVAMPNGKESKGMATDPDLGLDVKNFSDNSFHKNKDGDSWKKGLNYNRSFNVGYVMDIAKSSTEIKSIESQHGHIEKDEKIEDGIEIYYDQKAINGVTLGGDQKRLGITSVVPTQVFLREVKNLDANSRTSDPFLSANVSSVGNVKQTVETLPMKSKLPQVVSIISNNNLSVADISILRRWNKQSTSISQMNSLLLQARVSSHSAVRFNLGVSF